MSKGFLLLALVLLLPVIATVAVAAPTITLQAGTDFSSNNASVISGKYYNVSLNVLYNSSANFTSINTSVICDTSGLIHYNETFEINNSYLFSNIINISEVPLQRCRVLLLANDSDGVNETDYQFYVGGAILVNGVNQYDDTSFGDYYVNLSSADLTLNKVYVATPNFVIKNVSAGTYKINYTSSKFFDRYDTETLSGFMVSSTFSSYQAILNIYPEFLYPTSIYSDAYVNVVNYTLVNQQSGNINLSLNQDNMTFILNATTYDYNVSKGDFFFPANGTVSVSYRQNKSMNVQLGFLARLHIYDEKTGLRFYTDSSDLITFSVLCENETFVYVITSNETAVPILCNYINFRIVLNYGPVNYYRSLILDPVKANEFNVFLINLNTTYYTATNFVTDDMLNKYKDVRIYVYETIGNASEQITADYLDFDRKVSTYLITNNQYEVQVWSSNMPMLDIGKYIASGSGDKVIRLYSIGLLQKLDGTFGSDVTFGSFTDNSTGVLNAVIAYQDLGGTTTNVTWNLYQDNNGVKQLLYTNSYGAQTFISTFDISLYNKSTVISVLNISNTLLGSTPYIYGKTIHHYEKIDVGLLGWAGSVAFNWFLLIFFSILAVMANIKSSNMVSLIIIGLAILFTIFGWLQISAIVLALAAVIAFINLIVRGVEPQ